MLPHTLINPDILFSRSIPGKIFTHTIPHMRLPRSLIPESAQSFPDGEQQRFSSVVSKLEAGASAGTNIPGFDRVIQASSSPHNRHSPVFQAVDLVEAAGFIS